MFRIEAHASPDGPRLLAPEKLSRDDFNSIAVELKLLPFRARKTGLVAARMAKDVEPVETLWNGKETHDTAAPGDFIVTNLKADGSVLRDSSGHENRYVIRGPRFPDLYEQAPDNPQAYRSRVVVRAIYFAGGFEIKAPWDETQRAEAGYLLDNGYEVYGNARETFESTYSRI